MFMYLVYPEHRRQKRKPMSLVEPVSRVRPVRHVEYDSDAIPTQQLQNEHKITNDRDRTHDKISSQNKKNNIKQSDYKQPIGELYIQNALPLLLEWRYPKTAISPNYIEKQHERLVSVRPKHGGRDPISQ